ncbi:Fe-S cluster assembly ATPase SufC [Patescibacteria group bacterium]|nr:Fe-S cluster assembly ATPase SufC [Patescibacteria group bacterium]MCL5091203.1 Fe-S cluster assembly ATPase SufC [Patescibacteria group bacterium]
MLRYQRLTISVKGKVIVHDFSYRFQPGKVYAVMGPNGSGKSTVALTTLGHPDYAIKQGKIYFNGHLVNRLSADKRARLGMFLSFQTPPAINGVSLFQLLRLAVSGKMEVLALRKKIEALAKELAINHDLIMRPLNRGASGGERKKLELLQGLVLDRPLMIFDEIDSGVDVDALKQIVRVMKKHQSGHTYILITHYSRILKLLRPDRVLVIKSGRLVHEDGGALAQTIERYGYAKIP